MASLAGTKVISQDEMSQEIDLKRYLGRDASDSEVRLFAEIAIDRINNRTLDGNTIHGGSFKQYSEAYAEKKGVTRDNVDLFLEGDMLESVEATTDGNRVRIEIDGAAVDTKKGYNHHVGETLPKRPWFGITTSEAREIADSVRGEDIEDVVDEDVEPTGVLTLAQLRSIIDELGIEQTE